jgi:acetoin utilization protein AcuB
MEINLFVESDFPLLKPENTVFDALELMEVEKINQLVLLYPDKQVTILDHEDLTNYNDNLPIQDIPPRFIKPYLYEADHAYKAIEYLAKNKLDVCPIYDDNETLIGIVRTAVLLSQLAEKEFEGAGSLLSLKINTNDYSLADISRIIESEGFKIKQVHPLGGNAEHLDIVIRLNKTNSKAVLASLKRYGYQVELINGDNEEISIDKDRYGMLMKYLEI